MADKPVTRLASEMATKEQKKKRGFLSFLDDNITGGLVKVGDFFADGGNALVDMAKNPLDTAKQLGVTAKQTFYDPIANIPKAFDPTSGLSPLERVNTGLGGGLALADAFTPFMPEGALANALAKRAAENAVAKIAPNMTKPVGPTAADWFYGQYGLHGSPTSGIPQLEPRFGSNALPDEKVTFAHPLSANDYDLNATAKTALGYTDFQIPGKKPGSIYVAKYPRNAVDNNNPYGNFIISDAPGKVVYERKLLDVTPRQNDVSQFVIEDLISQNAVNEFLPALLADIKSPALRRKLVENLGKKQRDLEAERIANAAEMAASSARTARRWSGLGTGSGVS